MDKNELKVINIQEATFYNLSIECPKPVEAPPVPATPEREYTVDFNHPAMLWAREMTVVVLPQIAIIFALIFLAIRLTPKFLASHAERQKARDELLLKTQEQELRQSVIYKMEDLLALLLTNKTLADALFETYKQERDKPTEPKKSQKK